MKEHLVFFNRYQTTTDTHLRKKLEQLVAKKLISACFVDRFSLNCIKLTEQGSPVQVKSDEEVLHLFDDSPEEYAKVSDILLGKTTLATAAASAENEESTMETNDNSAKNVPS